MVHASGYANVAAFCRLWSKWKAQIFTVEVIWLGKFDHDRTLSSRTLESWFILGKSSPAELFRLVKYYHLPRYMVPIVTIDGYIYGIYCIYIWYIYIHGIYMVYMVPIIYPDLGLDRVHQIQNFSYWHGLFDPRTKRRDALYFPKSLLAEGATWRSRRCWSRWTMASL